MMIQHSAEPIRRNRWARSRPIQARADHAAAGRPGDESRGRHPVCPCPFRYLAGRGKDLLQTRRELSDFARLVAGSEPLLRALTNPAIPALRKRGVVEQLIARAGSLQPVVVKLLLLLAERDRLAILPDVAQAFDERVMDHQKVIKAEIVSAVALSGDSVTELTTA